MTPEQHNKYIEAIKEVQDRFKEMAIDPELSDEEMELLDTLPLNAYALLEQRLSAYVPADPEFDFLRLYSEKAVAVFLSLRKTFDEAYSLGEKSV